MKKIVILSFYSGLVDRGVETWALNIKKNLGNEFDIIILDGAKYGKEINWNIKSWIYWTFLVLRHAVSTFGIWSKADIIIPTNGGLQILFCKIVSFIYRKPLVVFGHAGLGADDKWNLICMPNKFVAFSERQKLWAFENTLPWTKVVKINHAVDLKKFIPAKNKPRKKIVLCVAADTRLKRIKLVKNAVSMLEGFKYLGIGKGNDKDVSYQEIPRVYKEADVFCFVPQAAEAFGLVYLEAMATNLPIVASDDPVRREIVGGAGILVKDPTDLKKLSESILTAYNKDWGNIPRKQAEKFGWDKIAPKYIELFNSLTNKIE